MNTGSTCAPTDPSACVADTIERMSLEHAHLLSRKRAKKFGHWFDYLMLAVAAFGPLALLPQIISIYQTQVVSGLVPVTWIAFSCMNILWLIYGVLHKQSPIILTSIMGCILNAAGAVGILLYL